MRLRFICFLMILMAQPVMAALVKTELAGAIEWQSDRAYDGAFLRVIGPSQFVYEKTFSAEDELVLEMDALASKGGDGQYRYEMLVFNTDKKQTLHSSGAFKLVQGKQIDSFQPESAEKVSQIVDDQVVQGSQCVGSDCAATESFGFDTLRLKENNLRIHFQDTSVSASFPTNDWRLLANDTTNGGASYFALEDVDGGYQSFRVAASAGANALTVSNGGNIGVGTLVAQQDVHVLRGDTPAMRFEQNITSGFAPQVWEVGGNESQFFVRNASAQNSMPFRILPNALSGLLTVGDVDFDDRVTINGELYIGSTQVTPDYVFTPQYKRLTIEEHAEFMYEKKHLPAVDAAVSNGKGGAVFNLSQRSQGVLEELEVAHLYIDELHQRLTALEEKLDKMQGNQNQSSVESN